jgi:hypothetical protein
MFAHTSICSPSQIKDLKQGYKTYTYSLNDTEHYAILDAENTKVCISKNYNFIFDKTNGSFHRWGKSFEDDPQFSPIGPELLDIEISVNGCPNACSFCYKSNTNKAPTNMSFQQFKNIIDKFPKTLTQVAFGITGIQTNPDFISMMEYCREIGVIPNFTLSGIDLTDNLAKDCARLAGALAVSAYQKDKNVCYDSVKKFTDLGMTQVNIHLMVSDKTLDFTYEVLNDMQTDPRLSKLNAIVFLGVKPKGRACDGYNPLSFKEFQKLVAYCFDNNLNIGFDSCSAPKFEAAVREMPISENRKKQLIQFSEGCESSLFSSYINVKGEYWHCSFSEDNIEHQKVDLSRVSNYITDLWYSDSVKKFRKAVLGTTVNGCRCCNIFSLD